MCVKKMEVIVFCSTISRVISHYPSCILFIEINSLGLAHTQKKRRLQKGMIMPEGRGSPGTMSEVAYNTRNWKSRNMDKSRIAR